MKLIIEAKDMGELMDNLLEEIPQMYVAFHSKITSGGNKLKWSIEEIDKDMLMEKATTQSKIIATDGNFKS